MFRQLRSHIGDCKFMSAQLFACKCNGFLISELVVSSMVILLLYFNLIYFFTSLALFNMFQLQNKKKEYFV